MVCAMVSGSQIREQIAHYLADRILLEEFENWFIQSTRDIRRTRSEAAISLAFDVEALLSEYSSGHIDEQELRTELSQTLQAENKIVEIVWGDYDFPSKRYSFKGSSVPPVLVPVRV